MSTTDVREIETLVAREQEFPKVRQPFRAHFEEEAFDVLIAHGMEDNSVEVGGILVGDVLKDRHGPYLHVQAVIKAEHAQEGDAEFTITHDAWEHINRVMDEQHQDRRILGWYHTHPGFGLFLSDRDLFIQQSFFNLPFQIALVFDPKSRQHGVFAWKEGSPWRLRSYFIGERECLWDGPRSPAEGEKPVRPKTADREDQSDLSPAEPEASGEPRSFAHSGQEDPRWGWTSFVLCFLLLMLGLGGGWLLASWKAAQAVQETLARAATGQAECAMVAYQKLNSDLLLLLRSQLDGENTLKPLEEIHSDLSAQVDSLAKALGNDKEKVVSKLRVPVNRLHDWLAKRGNADLALRQLELISRQKPVNPRALKRKQDKLRLRLANFHAEVAGLVAGKDGDLARRLLTGAADLDPEGYDRYNLQYQKTNPDQQLPRPSGAPRVLRTNEVQGDAKSIRPGPGGRGGASRTK